MDLVSEPLNRKSQEPHPKHTHTQLFIENKVLNGFLIEIEVQQLPHVWQIFANEEQLLSNTNQITLIQTAIPLKKRENVINI